MVIQVNTYNSKELILNNLVAALSNDPDLARINPELLPLVLQIIFICTGCDYLSFFSQIGKATFLRYFFQYASFITGGSETHPGTLADIGLEDGSYKCGYLAFIRLVGTTYLKKFASGFETNSPSTYFTTCVQQDTTPEQQHRDWLRSIRNTIWYRTKFENEMVASDEALMFHWKRVCWVANMWNQADRNVMLLQIGAGIQLRRICLWSGIAKTTLKQYTREYVLSLKAVNVSQAVLQNGVVVTEGVNAVQQGVSVKAVTMYM